MPPSRKSTKRAKTPAARLTAIESYLGKLYRFLNGYTWGDPVKKKKSKTKKKKGGGGGGQGSGSNPPKWPP